MYLVDTMTIISHKEGHLLSSIDEIPDEIISKLAKLSIATCEEFVSIVPNDMENYSKFMGIDEKQLLRIYEIIKKNMPLKETENLASQNNKEDFSYGAVSPYSKEFDEQLKKDSWH